MKRKLLRSLVLVLCLAVCLPLLSAAVRAEDGEEKTFGSFTYVPVEGGLMITDCDPETEGKVEIPAKIDGVKVIALGDRAFAGCDGVTELVIPNGIKTIGEECFADCAVTTLALPASVETLGPGALSASTLKTVTVHKSNKNFLAVKGVLFNKKQTTLVCFPAAVTGSYSLPNTVKKIGVRAFEGSDLTELKLTAKGKLATVAESAFHGSSLTAITLPKTVTALGEGAFAECAELRSVQLSSALTELPAGVFAGCAALESVTLPAKLTSIGERAFFGCEALTLPELPGGLTALGERAFAGCAAIESITLPFGIVEIPNGAFDGCAALKELTLVGPVVSVGSEAFASTALESLTLPASVTSVGERAFAGCDELDEVVFDHEVDAALTLGQGAFALTGSGADTTVRVPEPDKVCRAVAGYDWKADGRTVSYAQNENFTVRTVKLTGVESIYGGVMVTWTPLDAAESYLVGRKAESEADWTWLSSAFEPFFYDTTLLSGNTYYYTVCAQQGSALSRHDPAGLSVHYIAAPSFTSVYNSAAGVELRWTPVNGATTYRISRQVGGGESVKLLDTTATSYTDRAVALGQKYSYSVCCVSDDGLTVLSSTDPQPRTITYYPLATPELRKLSVGSGGVSVEWDAVGGASKYRVFRKSGGDWERLGDTTSTSFTDTTAKIGTKYAYTVRCISGDGRTYLSNYNAAGLSVTRAGTPKLTGVANVNGGVEVKWNAASGAVKYRLFRKSGSGNWQKVGDTTSTSLVDKKASSGTTYSYTVRCVTSDGAFYAGDYDHTGLSIRYLAAPKLHALVGSGKGVEIKWDGVSGAARYRVFRKSGDSWKNIGETSGTSFVDGGVSAGKKYTYTVRCISADGSSYTSGYNHSGVSITYLAAPRLSSVGRANGGVQIKWNKVSGASKYRVFRKSGSGSWQRIGDTSSTSFVDKSAKKGVTYTYTVRCLTPDGHFAGGYDGGGLSFTP